MIKDYEKFKAIEAEMPKIKQFLREPELIKMSNIFRELGYVMGTPPKELLVPCCYDRSVYFEYTQWLRSQGMGDWTFR